MLAQAAAGRASRRADETSFDDMRLVLPTMYFIRLGDCDGVLWAFLRIVAGRGFGCNPWTRVMGRSI